MGDFAPTKHIERDGICTIECCELAGRQCQLKAVPAIQLPRLRFNRWIGGRDGITFRRQDVSLSPNLMAPSLRYAVGAINTTPSSRLWTAIPSSRTPAQDSLRSPKCPSDGTLLEPAPGPQGNLDGARASVRRGLRINRSAARARGIEGALRMGGRRCDLRRQQQRNLTRAARALGGPVMAPPQRATVGDFVGLCLLIDFPDEPGTITRDEVERFCNEQGYSGFGKQRLGV